MQHKLYSHTHTHTHTHTPIHTICIRGAPFTGRRPLKIMRRTPKLPLKLKMNTTTTTTIIIIERGNTRFRRRGRCATEQVASHTQLEAEYTGRSVAYDDHGEVF